MAPSPRLPLSLRTYTTRRLPQPTKFRPPSHPTRQRADPLNYPGPPTSSAAKHYPHTFPAADTWSHFVLSSRRLHFYVSLGVLTTLAAVVSIADFVNTSPQAKGVYWKWTDPAGSAGSLVEAWRDAALVQSREVREMRARQVEDVIRREEFRRVHGGEVKEGEGREGRDAGGSGKGERPWWKLW